MPLARLLHSKFFEERLAFHISTFAERRSELNLLFTSYAAGRTQETNEIATRVEYKVDNLVNILRHFDSSREKEATKFIEYNGGIERCISDKTLFVELMGKTGEAISVGSDAGQAQKVDLSVTNLMKQLQRELGEDIEEALKKNMANFEAMLRIQNNNLQHMSHLMENQTSEIMKMSNEIAMIFPGMRKHVLLTDPVSSPPP
jgi:Ni,Fe-hydrogenase I large subunit